MHFVYIYITFVFFFFLTFNLFRTHSILESNTKNKLRVMVSVLSTLFKLYMISEKFYGVKLYSLEKSINKIPFSLPNYFSLSFTIYKTLKHKKKLQKIEKKMEKKWKKK